MSASVESDASFTANPVYQGFKSVMNNHHSVRQYIKDQSPPLSLIRTVLSAARFSPSAHNGQPWGVCVIGGDSTKQLVSSLLTAYDAPTDTAKLEYANRPKELHEREQNNLAEFGKAYHAIQGVSRDDPKGRKVVDRRNYTLFDAPIDILIHAPAGAVAGTFLDMGVFVSSLVHLFESAGLGCCPQFSVSKYAKILRSITGYGEDRVVVCGFCVGYADGDAKINTFRAPKMKFEQFVSWHGVADAPASPDSKTDTKSSPSVVPVAPAKTGPESAAFIGLVHSMHSHRSCRQFLPNRVPPASVIRDCLSAARYTVSSQNNQPWAVCVVGGSVRTALSTALLAAFDSGADAKNWYLELPKQPAAREQRWISEYESQFLALQQDVSGTAASAASGDSAAAVQQKKIERLNHTFYDAPYTLIVHAPANAADGTFIDVGAFIGAVIHLIETTGLSVSLQSSTVTKYTDVIRTALAADSGGFGKDRMVVCALSVGYADPSAPINLFRPARMELNELATLHGVDWNTAASSGGVSGSGGSGGSAAAKK